MFFTSFTESLMTYALGRRVEYTDMPLVRSIVRDAAKKDNKLSSFVLGVVNSPAFKMGIVDTGKSERRAADVAPQHEIRGAENVSDSKASVAPHGSQGCRRHHGAAVPRGDGAGSHASAQAARGKVRLAAIEMVHGSAGSTAFGIKKNMWAPAAVGRDFDLSPSALQPLEPFRDHITIISNTDVRNAEAFTAPEIGGDHFRSSAVFLTQMHPKQTQGSDVFVGTSLDQFYAQQLRPGHGDSVDAAVHRERGPGRRLLLRLFVHLHRLDQLGGAESAAADDPRPAHRVRPAVRRRRHAGRAQGAPRRGQEHPRLAQHRGGAA